MAQVPTPDLLRAVQWLAWIRHEVEKTHPNDSKLPELRTLIETLKATQ